MCGYVYYVILIIGGGRVVARGGAVLNTNVTYKCVCGRLGVFFIDGRSGFVG